MPPKSKKTQNSDNYLLIVESPSKCAKIESYLGERYQCISSKGHIREIDGLSSINTKDKFQIEYTLIKDKRDHIETMRKTVAKYSPLNILLATDDDREGEAIAWHICQVCGLDPVKTPRIVFHEITQPALLAAVNAPTRIKLSLVAAQQARQVLDIIVGFKISPLLWRNIGRNKKNALSAGRCQTPALRLIYDHHQKYTELRATGVTQIHRISAIFTTRQIKFDLDTDITSQESLLEFLEKSKTNDHHLTIGQTRPSTRAPPKPFNTSRLLQTASNQYRLSPKQTMNLCQTLYQSGLITYMRTDCQKYSDVFLKKAAEYIAEKYGGEAYVGDLSAIRIVDTTMPHEGIRVTNLALTSMTSNDAALSRLYGLIWRNTVESCMTAAKYNMTEYSVNSPLSPSLNPNNCYKYTMETPVFLGWRRVEITGNITQTQATESTLAFYLEQIAKMGSPLNWSLIESKSTIDSRLPHHYTEAALIQKLEDLGIGRPSTFSSIVETIQERGYVKKTDVAGIRQKCVEYKLRSAVVTSQQCALNNASQQCALKNASQQCAFVLEKTELEKSFGDEKDKLVIQPTGILVLEFLLQHFDDCFSYDYTKSMESELDILASQTYAESTATWHQICRKCFDDITERSKPLAKQTKQTFALADSADHVLVFNTYGASIKLTSGQPQYSKIRADIELDLEKAKRGEYTMAELIWREDNGCLGEYQGTPVYLKTGKFGLYAEWTPLNKKQTISLKPLAKSANDIKLQDVIRLITSSDATTKDTKMTQEDAAAMFLPVSCFEDENEGEDKRTLNVGSSAASGGSSGQFLKREVTSVGIEVFSERSGVETTSAAHLFHRENEKTSIRILRSDLSIRKGKYGPYIFHKSTHMQTPKFYPLKPLKDKWQSMSNLELIAAIENTYHISI